MNLFKKFFSKKTSDKNINESTTIFKSHLTSDSFFSNQVDRNLKGKEYEQKGETELAILEYEANLKEGFEGSHPYNRLAIIYRKNKDYDNEIRVLNRSIDIYKELSKTSPRGDFEPKLLKFKERLEKAVELKNAR